MAARLFGVAADRFARGLARLAEPAFGAVAGVGAPAACPLAGIVAELRRMTTSLVGAVADPARDVVKPVPQGLGVEPAARVHAGLDALIARRAAALVQQQGRQSDPG